MDGAAGAGYLEVVRWLAANRREGCSKAAFELASAAGHLDVVMVRKRCVRCGSRPHLVFSSSTQFGRLGMAHVCVPINLLEKLETLFEPYSLTFAREPPTPIVPHTKCATDLGYCLCWFLDGALRVTQWLQEAGFLRCSSAGWDNAAGGGHLHVLKVIFRQLRVPFSVHGRNDSWSVLLGYYTNAKQCPPSHVCPCIPANYLPYGARCTVSFHLNPVAAGTHGGRIQVLHQFLRPCRKSRAPGCLQVATRDNAGPPMSRLGGGDGRSGGAPRSEPAFSLSLQFFFPPSS